LSLASEPLAAGRSAAAMRFILVTVLIDMVAIGLIVPVLPHLVGKFAAEPEQQTFWAGMVMFAFSIANFIGSPILGALSDHFGRRPVLLIGFCGLALNFFATALATVLWVLVAVRLVGGAMQSNQAVANAYVADITPPEQRARNFGLVGAMFGIGFILGPVMGGVLGAIDLHLPFFVAGGLAILNWLYGYFVLPESLPAERRSPFHWKKANPIAALSGLAGLHGIGPLVLVIALSNLAQFILYTTWVLYTSFKFGWGPWETGWSLFVVGVTSALVQGVLLKRLLARFSPERLAVMGMVSSCLVYVAYGGATQGWMMYVFIACNLLGFAATAAMQSIVSNAADAQTQGRTMGAVSSLSSLMAVLAPVLGTPLLAAVSHLPRGDWRMGLPFYTCALLQGLAAWVAVRHFARRRAARAAALSSSIAPDATS
jgi:DHA1 family tetracycline resistance protein-like MFS transporter